VIAASSDGLTSIATATAIDAGIHQARARPMDIEGLLRLRPNACILHHVMRSRVQICRGFLAALAVAAGVAAPRGVSAQTISASGGVMIDARRYDSDGSGPKVYDGQPAGGFFGVDVRLWKRCSAEFETSFSGDATTTITNPISIAGATPVDFATTYHTRMQTYSGLFAVNLTPSARVHVSVRGGATYLHHRREIIPPTLLPADPRATTPTQPIEIVDNVWAPAVGADADVPLSSRLAIVAAVRANWFKVAPELRAYSVRPMLGVRVFF
jgi:hypothetical protein